MKSLTMIDWEVFHPGCRASQDLTLSLDMMKYNPDQEKEIQILNNPKLEKAQQT